MLNSTYWNPLIYISSFFLLFITIYILMLAICILLYVYNYTANH